MSKQFLRFTGFKDSTQQIVPVDSIIAIYTTEVGVKLILKEKVNMDIDCSTISKEEMIDRIYKTLLDLK